MSDLSLGTRSCPYLEYLSGLLGNLWVLGLLGRDHHLEPLLPRLWDTRDTSVGVHLAGEVVGKLNTENWGC